jgi:hypothetical protein
MNLSEDVLLKALPHGSGINNTWEIEEHKNKFECKNSYQVMNEAGFYIGWADFTVIVPKTENFYDMFTLHFNGSAAQRFAQRYFLREYLEEEIYYCLETIK